MSGAGVNGVPISGIEVGAAGSAGVVPGISTDSVPELVGIPGIGVSNVVPTDAGSDGNPDGAAGVLSGKAGEVGV